MSSKKTNESANSIIHILKSTKSNKVRGLNHPQNKIKKITTSKLKEKIEKERLEKEKQKPKIKKLLVMRRGSDNITKQSALAINRRIKKESIGKKLVVIRKTNIPLPNKKPIIIKPLSTATKKCLLIGINYTGTSNQLSGCLNDSENMKKFLIDNKYFAAGDITTMNDTKIGSNLYPTKSNILVQINSMITFAKNNPSKPVLLFLAYSGHGSQVADTSGDEPDKLDEVLCPIDCLNNSNNLIIDDDLKATIMKLPSNVKMVIFLDCCHSATMMDVRYQYEVDSKNKFVVLGSQIETLAEVVVISGCIDSSVSYDAYVKNQAQGAFSAAFFSCWKPNISYFDLITNIRTWLKQNNFPQFPQLSSGKQINVSAPFLLNNFK
jgi:hypothetical protein